MVQDLELLRQYAEEKSDAAFAEFVRRHVDLVYGAALRRLGDDVHLAEDVTQQVFTVAARQAARLAQHPTLVGWLFTATRNRAVQVVRTERRRRAREREAFAMNAAPPEPVLDWQRLRPVIDDGLDRLSASDRQVVLLRFFENRSYRDIAAQIGTGENAARMRVDRALERLNALLQRKGLTSTSVALGTVLLADAMTAAPAGLATAATSAAIATAPSASVLTFMGLAKIHIATAAVAIAIGGTGWVVQHRAASRAASGVLALQAEFGDAERVAAENAMLRRQRIAAERAAAANAATVAELERKTDLARQKLAALREETAQARARSRPRPNYTGPVYDIAALDTPPQPTLRQPPDYPEELRRQGVTGKVLVEFVVGPDGKVAEARALSATHPDFAQAAVTGVERWEFSPGKLQGAVVGTRVQIPVTFAISDPVSGVAPSSPPTANGKVHLPISNWF